MALALARRGFRVALVGRRAGPLAAVAGEVEALGGQALALPADLTEAGVLPALLEQAEAGLGPLDLLVHNAGVLAGGPLDSHTAQGLAGALALNLAVPLELTRLALPQLRARRGMLLLVGSMASTMALPYASLYSATKAGLHGFGQSLRHELAPHGVRVVLAYPPGTATAMTAGMAAASGSAASWLYRLRCPEAVGERIVQRMLAGQNDIRWWNGEGWLATMHQLAPGLVQRLLRGQATRFARMFGEK
jgi:short-subunit dehydrogenase